VIEKEEKEEINHYTTQQNEKHRQTFIHICLKPIASIVNSATDRTRMWANAQRDGRRAEHRWRPLFNAAVWL